MALFCRQAAENGAALRQAPFQPAYDVEERLCIAGWAPPKCGFGRGYYDAGDGVKFSFPMAFATTMLSWGVVEYGAQMDSAGELENALAAIRGATDYLLKTNSKPGVIYAQVGDPNSDHACWERAEDMDTPCSVFWVDASKPGSDLAGEIAAVLAASSLAFKAYDRSYSDILLTRVTRVFQFAEVYRGCYSNAFSNAICPYYCSYSGYEVDYILGDNPMGMSYMVGYGAKYPRRIHHRGSSLPCMSSHPEHISCKDGFEYLSSGQANPNLLIGAVSGGPDNYDKYAHDRSNYEQSEPALYINAPLVGALAYLTGIPA
ncbi:hypothetical protein L7F22_050954 [Adiantum nelumboides]|nr:hypothetical protein [Adiantum nelumboides]